MGILIAFLSLSGSSNMAGDATAMVSPWNPSATLVLRYPLKRHVVLSHEVFTNDEWSAQSFAYYKTMSKGTFLTNFEMYSDIASNSHMVSICSINWNRTGCYLWCQTKCGYGFHIHAADFSTWITQAWKYIPTSVYFEHSAPWLTSVNGVNTTATAQIVLWCVTFL